MSVIRKVKLSNIVVSDSEEILDRSGRTFLKALVQESAVNSIVIISGRSEGPAISSDGLGTFDLNFISRSSGKFVFSSENHNSSIVVKNISGGGVSIRPHQSSTSNTPFTFPGSLPSSSKALFMDPSGNIIYGTPGSDDFTYSLRKELFYGDSFVFYTNFNSYSISKSLSGNFYNFSGFHQIFLNGSMQVGQPLDSTSLNSLVSGDCDYLFDNGNYIYFVSEDVDDQDIFVACAEG